MGTRIVTIDPEVLKDLVTTGIGPAASLGYTQADDPMTVHPWPEDVDLHRVWQRLDTVRPHGFILLELTSDAWDGEEIEIDVILQSRRGDG